MYEWLPAERRGQLYVISSILTQSVATALFSVVVLAVYPKNASSMKMEVIHATCAFICVLLWIAMLITRKWPRISWAVICTWTITLSLSVGIACVSGQTIIPFLFIALVVLSTLSLFIIGQWNTSDFQHGIAKWTQTFIGITGWSIVWIVEQEPFKKLWLLPTLWLLSIAVNTWILHIAFTGADNGISIDDMRLSLVKLYTAPLSLLIKWYTTSPPQAPQPEGEMQTDQPFEHIFAVDDI